MISNNLKENNLFRLLFWFTYSLLASFRISTAIYLHPGYLHPDEYFQSVEIAAGEVYDGICYFRTWEFQNIFPGPIRSRTAIWPFVHLPIYVAHHIISYLKLGDFHFDGLVNNVLLPTRLFSVILSFIPDLYIFWLSRRIFSIHSINPEQYLPAALLLYSSMTYGGLVWGGRTLSNSWELVLLCLFNMLSLHKQFICLILQAGIAIWACFIRPTFVVFICPIVIYQLILYSRSQRKNKLLFIYVPLAFLFATFFSILIIYFDTEYYSLNKFSFKNAIVTPLRFMFYNSETKNLNVHGLHPWYSFFAIHWPLMLTPIGTFAAFYPVWPVNKSTEINFVCWLSILIPTVVFSFVPHKETRFLMPCIPHAIILAVENISSYFSKKNCYKLLTMCCVFWLVYQITLAIFWDILHQGGLLPLLRSLPSSFITADINVFHRTYMPPRFPFGNTTCLDNDVSICLNTLKTGNNCQNVIDFAGAPEKRILNFFSCIKGQLSVVRVVFPGTSIPTELNFSDFGEILKINKFFPHVSTEYLPSVSFPSCSLNLNLFSCMSIYLENLKSQLSLHSYLIKVY